MFGLVGRGWKAFKAMLIRMELEKQAMVAFRKGYEASRRQKPLQPIPYKATWDEAGHQIEPCYRAYITGYNMRALIDSKTRGLVG